MLSCLPEWTDYAQAPDFILPPLDYHQQECACMLGWGLEWGRKPPQRSSEAYVALSYLLSDPPMPVEAGYAID